MRDTGVDFDVLRRQLSRSVARVCPRWLAEHREDIVQVALLRVLRSVRSRESNDPPPASFYWKVAYSATIDEIRRARRRREVVLDETVPERPAPDSTADPHRRRLLRELGAAALECLRRIVPSRRAVVRLHLLGDSVAEIMNVLALNEKKVRNLLHRGLADLRRCIAARGIAP